MLQKCTFEKSGSPYVQSVDEKYYVILKEFPKAKGQVDFSKEIGNLIFNECENKQKLEKWFRVGKLLQINLAD